MATSSSKQLNSDELIKFLNELNFQLSDAQKNENEDNSLSSNKSISSNLLEMFPNYEKLIDEVIRRCENYDERKKQQEKNSKQNEELKANISQLTVTVEDQEKKITSLNDLKKDIDKSLDEKKKECENFKKELDEKKNECKNFINQIENLKKELETSNKKCIKLDKKIQEMTRSENVIQNTGSGTVNVHQGPKEDSNVVKLKTECNQLKEKNSNLEKEKSDLKSRIESLNFPTEGSESMLSEETPP